MTIPSLNMTITYPVTTTTDMLSTVTPSTIFRNDLPNTTAVSTERYNTILNPLTSSGRTPSESRNYSGSSTVEWNSSTHSLIPDSVYSAISSTISSIQGLTKEWTSEGVYTTKTEVSSSYMSNILNTSALSTINISLLDSTTSLTTVFDPIVVSSGPLVQLVNNGIFMNTLLPSLIYVCILLILGIPGNILVVYIYASKWNRCTSRTFILALGSYDLLNCVASLSTEIALIANFFQFDIPVWCKLSRFTTASVNSGSTFILVAIAIDRYKRICKIHQKAINPSLALKLVFISIIFALATSWPALFLYGTYTISFPMQKFVVIGKTCLIEDQMSTTVFPFIFVIFLLTCHFFVDIILIVLYTFIGKTIFSQRKVQKSLRGEKYRPGFSKASLGTDKLTHLNLPSEIGIKPEISQTSFTMEDIEDVSERKRLASFVILERNSRQPVKPNPRQIKPKKHRRMFVKELKLTLSTRTSNNSMECDKGHGRKIHARKTTLMLFLVTIGFVIAFLPYSILVIIRYTDRTFYYSLSNIGKSLYQLFLRSYLLNSVLNPFVYCFVSKQFRQESKNLFSAVCCCNTD